MCMIPTLSIVSRPIIQAQQFYIKTILYIILHIVYAVSIKLYFCVITFLR